MPGGIRDYKCNSPKRINLAKLLHNQTYKTAIICIAALFVLPGHLALNANALHLAYSNGNVSGLVTVADNKLPLSKIAGQNTAFDDTTAIACPEDISIYTDLNSCDVLITSGLSIRDPENIITSLNWQMEGATTDQSNTTGVNQISSYVFNEGTTVITYRGRTRYNNPVSCTFTVTVTDNEVPKLIYGPGNITVTNNLGECQARVTWTRPIVSDNCVSKNNLRVESNHNPGDIFPVGETEVVYRISDGVNELTHRFTIKVKDDKAPELIAPEPRVIVCGDEVEDAFTSWKQFEQAGGKASDNCGVDYNSFRYVSQTASDIRCPYLITRIYSIADVNGNVSEVKRYIQVTGEEPEEIGEGNEQSDIILKSGASTTEVTISEGGVTEVSCKNGNDGTITINVTSTSPNYTVSWSGSASGSVSNLSVSSYTITGLIAGSYSITVTDQDNIPVSLPGTVMINEPALLTATVSSQTKTCFGQSTGTATIEAVGGTAPYRFSNDNGSTFSSAQATPYTFSNLDDGVYNLVVRDDNDCEFPLTVTITSYNELDPGTIRTGVVKFCEGGTEPIGGNVPTYDLPSGGSGDYTIVWQIDEGCVNGWTDIPGSNTPSYTPDAPASTSCYRRKVIDNECGDEAYSGTMTFEIYDDLVSQDITPNPNLAEVCAEIDLSATFSGGSGGFPGAYTDVYEFSTDGSGNWSTYNPDDPIPTDGLSGTGIVQIRTRREPNAVDGCNYGEWVYYTWTVNPLPTATISGDNGPICSGEDAEFYISGSPDDAVVTYSLDGGSTTNTVALTLGTATITIGNATSDQNLILISVENPSTGCSQNLNDSESILINPLPVASAGGSITICDNDSYTLTASDASAANGTIVWTHDGNGSLTNETSETPTYTANTADEGSTVTLMMVVTSSFSCVTATDTAYYSVIVDSNHSLVHNTSSGSNNQTLCINTPLTDIIFTLGGGATGIISSNLPSGITGFLSGNTYTISGIPDMENVYNYSLTTTGNSCTDTTVTGTIIVEPFPYASAGGSDTICHDGFATVSGAVMGNGTVLWTHDGNGALTNNTTLTPTYTAGPGDEGSTVTLTMTVTSDNSCGISAQSSDTYTVLVRDILTAPLVSSSQTICYNSVPANLTAPSATGGSSPYLYQWQSSPDGTDGSWADIGSANSNSYTPPALIETTYYRLQVTDDGNPSCGTVYSNVIWKQVVDDEKPRFDVPTGAIAYAGAGCIIDTTATATGTGYILGVSDNCTAVGDLEISYTDGDFSSNGCAGSFTFERTWTVRDEKGNDSIKVQYIEVIDNTAPNISVPSNITLYCASDNTHPDETGWATATDNCDGVLDHSHISYADVVIDSTCEGRYTIERTWSAVDDCGNPRTAVNKQKIIVSDNAAPTVNMEDLTVSCPSDIPPIYANIDSFLTNPLNSVTDNCGGVTIKLLFENEISYGLEDKPGYCPDYVERTYRFEDPCGNHRDLIQTIVVNNTCGCSFCDDNTTFGWVDFLGDPKGDTTFYNVIRNGKCCPEAEYWQKPGNNPFRCVSYNVRIDDDAVGVQITIDAGAKPDVKEWLVDCQNVTLSGPDGDIICLPSGGFHTFTYCKQGANPNDIRFGSVPGIIVSDDIETRVDCSGTIETDGTFTNPRWNSISPGNRGDYNDFLDLTDPYNPIFTAEPGSPPVIQYEVCADFAGYICNADGTNCDTINVYVAEEIGIDININPDVVCENDLPTIKPVISPEANYVLEWYVGYFEGTPIVADSFQIQGEGLYTLVATEYESGLPCNSAWDTFRINYDYTGPAFVSISEPLEVYCNDPANTGLINTWLNNFTATFFDENGNEIDTIVSNDYAGITNTCGDTTFVEFSAYDRCGNGTDTISYIVVLDTTPPTIICPSDTTNVADPDECLIQDFPLRPPITNDNCDPAEITIEWTKSDATIGDGTDVVINPFNVGLTTVTYTAIDKCGNRATCKQIIEIVDEQPPGIIICPHDTTINAVYPGCDAIVFDVDSIEAEDNCTGEDLNLFWKKIDQYGNVFESDPGYVNGTVFPIGETDVIYYVSDIYGNVDSSCVFTVTVRDTIPPDIIDCNNDPIIIDLYTVCDTFVEVATPDVDDPCDGPFYVVHDSEYTGDNDTVASGVYPIGYHEVTWTITDQWGNDTFCVQIIDIRDAKVPVLDCPDSWTIQADTLESFATNIDIPWPTIEDNCPIVLNWVLKDTLGNVLDTSANYALQDTNYVPSPFDTLQLGDNDFTYYLMDIDSNIITCEFTVTVESRPVIVCPPDTTIYADENCEFLLDPGVAELIQGGQPIDWTWVINRTGETGGSRTPDDGNEPLPIVELYPHEYPFQLDTTTITWTASNTAGSDWCTQTIVVTDTTRPLVYHLDSLEDCMEMIYSAIYNSATDDLYDPDRPDYLLFEAGDTTLDLEYDEYIDNCDMSACNDSITWQIDFTDVPDQNPPHNMISTPQLKGTGQISEYPLDILFPGDGTYMGDVEHWVSYFVTDCSGNTSLVARRKVIVNPRPKIDKVTN